MPPHWRVLGFFLIKKQKQIAVTSAERGSNSLFVSVNIHTYTLKTYFQAPELVCTKPIDHRIIHLADSGIAYMTGNN